MATLNDPMKKYAQSMANPIPTKQNTVSNAAKNYISAMSSPAQSNVAQSNTTQVNSSPVSRTDQTLNRINDLTNQNYTFTKPQEFSYDQNTDPAYQAALASARQNITQQQADTNAHLRVGGQGKSSYSESVANQIGAREMGRVSTDVLPQLISQAYQRYVDSANRDLAVQQANYGVTQDRISNLGSLYGLQNQQDFVNPMQEAQLTGQYLSGEARQYINAINNLKAQAETPGITAAARSQLSSQADQYRQALQGLGIDSSLFGADVNRTGSMANMNRAGITTLAGQQQQYVQQADQRDFTAQQERYAVQDQQWQQQFGVTLAQITGYMPDGTPTSAQQQQDLNNLWMVADQTGVIPNQLASIYGLQPGTPTRSAKEFAAQLAISQQNANSSSTSAAASYMNAVTNSNQEKRLSSTSSASSNASSNTKVNAKSSYALLNDVLGDFNKSPFMKNDARNYLDTLSNQLTDADYKKALDYINENGR